MNEPQLDTAVDLSACEREPIHIPGSIQPHGMLLALDAAERIVHASANVCPPQSSAAEIVGKPLREAWPELAAQVADVFDGSRQEQAARQLNTVRLGVSGGPCTFDAVAHRSGPLLILELEEVRAEQEVGLDALYPQLRGFVEQLQAAASVESLCVLAAADLRRITGFDRVLIYRFDADWNGTVLAEDRNETLPSYLGLRFPASDIPAQARELYRRNRLRIIPDAAYVPVPIVPALDPASRQPLDLSHSVLRSVSPVHVEYMRNMGTTASMSISILREGALWGLISCHSKGPRRLPLRLRNGCDVFTQIFSLRLGALEQAAEAERRIGLRVIQAKLLAHMAEEERFLDGLLKHPDDLMELAQASGAAIVSSDHCWRMGSTPSEPQIRALVDWLSAHQDSDVFATDALVEWLPESKDYAARASGLLAISISKVRASYVLWSRPELVQTVSWGGDPNKPAEEGSAPERLHPRKSFDIWKEVLRNRSLPWDPSEVEAAKDLRNAIVGIVLRRAEEMASLAEELQRSNKELEAFSYSVSHDLRAPFRHIVGYAELLRSRESSGLTERGRRYVETIIESAYNAGALVDGLLSYAQMGRAALNLRPIDMNALVNDTRRRLMVTAQDRRIVWRIGDLAPVRADPMMLGLVVENLLTNAIKYTRLREEAVITVACRREGREVIFSVADNGIGFDMACAGKLFGVFQRLHRMEDFEGTGIGLANVRRIVERHGGRVWAEGAVNQGATFSFALPAQNGAA